MPASNSKKSLIVHVTCGKHQSLKTLLDLNGLFKKHYDGWECTMSSNTIQSARYYYYDIAHSDLTKMIKFLVAH